MLDLPDVTLVMIETLEHDLARLAIMECLDKARFGEVLIFTDKPNMIWPQHNSPTRIIEVPNWPTKIGWSKFSWHGVPPYVRTRQTLYIQWDAWIWDASMWRDEYLDYDIIGAPWWYKDGKNVGNLGFAIRSKRLIQYLYNHQREFPVTTDLDDDLLCRKYRPQLEDAGFVWAPERVASDFAFECTRPAPDSRHFGFHAAFNFNEVLSPDALMERARLMFKSPYIKRAGHIWKAFVQKNPDIVQQLQQEADQCDAVHDTQQGLPDLNDILPAYLASKDTPANDSQATLGVLSATLTPRKRSGRPTRSGTCNTAKRRAKGTRKKRRL